MPSEPADEAVLRRQFEAEMEQAHDVMPDWWWNRSLRNDAFVMWRKSVSDAEPQVASGESLAQDGSATP